MSLQLQLSLLLLIYLICRVDGVVEMHQQISLTKSMEKVAIINCDFPKECEHYIHWYQKKEGETLKRILYSRISDEVTQNESGDPSFKSEKTKSNRFVLKVNHLTKQHSATYYCACWISDSTACIYTEDLHKNSFFKTKPQLFCLSICYLCDQRGQEQRREISTWTETQKRKPPISYSEKVRHYSDTCLSVTMTLLLQLYFVFFTYLICRVDGDQKLEQKMSEVKAKTKTVTIDCQFPSNCQSYIHWYQQKEGETLKRILYSSINDGSATNDADRKVFGSGTRLYVTVSGKDKVKEPTLKAYKQSKIQGDKRTLVCQASDMVPDLVKFSWQTKSSSGDWTNVPDQQVIEQRDEVGKENPPNVVVTSMVIVDENTVKNNNYRCSVKHEGTTAPKTADITKDEGKSSAGNKDVVKATCPPIEENTEQKQKSETMDETPSLYLFIYAYGIMLMKNGVYFVAVSLYLFKRRFGKKNEST